MTNTKIERKLAVILVADVVGYSKHMENDEDATLEAYSECEKILEELLNIKQGSIFNTAGDSVLAEFNSAVNAVECAVEFQNKIKERNQSQDSFVKLEYRIGINMGDVVSREGNLLGDGVNIAARLEALSQPNGVCISKSIYDLVVPKTKMTFNDLGVQKVKQNEFHAYDILLDPSQKRDLGSSKHLFKIKPAYLAGVAVVILALGGGFLFFQKSLNKNKISSTEFAYEIPSKPSLAVMPFKYLSEDQSEEYISLGLTQNITNALSRSSEIFIISYSSAKKAAETLPDPASISKALGVKYILTGSVQKMDKNLRVNVELVDVLKGNNVWVNQMDGTVDNLFMFQDQITDNIFENFQINLLSSVLGKSSSNFSSVDEMREVMRFREYFLKFSKEGYLNAKEIADQLYKNKDSGPANLAQGWLNFAELMMGMTEDRKATIDSGKKYAKVAHEIMNDGLSLVVGAWMDLFSGDAELARKKVAKAIEIDSSGDVLAGAGNIFLLTGDPEAAKNIFKKSMRLTPFHPAWYPNRLSEALIMLGEYDEAKTVLAALLAKESEESVSLRGKSRALVALSVIAGLQGDIKNGTEKIKELRLLNPNFDISSVKSYLGLMSDKEFLARYLNTAEKMGLPNGK